MINEHIKNLKPISQAFIAATDDIWIIFNELPKEVKIKTGFSNIFMKAYQIFMIEIFPSMQREVDNGKYYSAAILCRSALDIIFQLAWILSLDEDKKSEAIEVYLNFDGVGVKENRKKTYSWQELILPSYKSRTIGLDIGLDQEIVETVLKNGESVKITTFDYLSRITHWNPQIINNLIGINSKNHLIFHGSEYENIALMAVTKFVSCTITFTLLFVDYFYPEMLESINKKMEAINNNFFNALPKLNCDLIVN